MLTKLLLLIAGSFSVVALYIMMAFLAMLAGENELPDLDDIQV